MHNEEPRKAGEQKMKNPEDIHFVVVRSHLRAVGKEHGLLLNFARTKLEPKRVIAS